MTTIAAPHCDCADCRAAHWAEAPAATFTAHEVADAWQDGHATGTEHALRSIVTVITEWLKSDPCEPVKDEAPDGRE
jgi:hypothetical protein